MSREVLIIFFAVVVFLLPFIGIPGAWKTPLYVIAALAITGLALIVRQERLWFIERKRRTDAYTENHAGAAEPRDVAKPQREGLA